MPSSRAEQTDVNGNARRLAKDHDRDARVPGMRISEARYINIAHDTGLLATAADVAVDL